MRDQGGGFLVGRLAQLGARIFNEELCVSRNEDFLVKGLYGERFLGSAHC